MIDQFDSQEEKIISLRTLSKYRRAGGKFAPVDGTQTGPWGPVDNALWAKFEAEARAEYIRKQERKA
ncbi:phage protein [Pseudomonas phage R12]|uniref:Phage protein n=2 Tax=Pbunavirus TaxID=1198980 RepID=A0A455XH65_9CAUD|nr:phage protein [Pseudomonas phage R12]YP_009914070.1 hypothetical protein H6S69_gp46 [Pseudomonas phage Epa13]QIQ64853.1 hypothetical protein 13_00046 [Pseudomonas phage Epa13]BBJ26661.1 phage protein [Pseudomonas phage R12]